LYSKVLSKIWDKEKNLIFDLEEEKGQINSRYNTINLGSIKRDFKHNLQDQTRREKRIKAIDRELKKTMQLKKSINDLENTLNKYSENLFASTPFLDPQFKILEDL
jgi:uncharacterized protein YlxW (UPF0749 family)